MTAQTFDTSPPLRIYEREAIFAGLSPTLIQMTRGYCIIPAMALHDNRFQYKADYKRIEGPAQQQFAKKLSQGIVAVGEAHKGDTNKMEDTNPNLVSAYSGAINAYIMHEENLGNGNELPSLRASISKIKRPDVAVSVGLSVIHTLRSLSMNQFRPDEERIFFYNKACDLLANLFVDALGNSDVALYDGWMETLTKQSSRLDKGLGYKALKIFNEKANASTLTNDQESRLERAKAIFLELDKTWGPKPTTR